MLAILVVLLAVLWFFGYVHISGFNVPDVVLFTINGNEITLWNFLIWLVVVVAIGILPGPFRVIAGILLILWILSVLGVFSIAGIGLSNVLVLAIIVGLVFSMFSAAL